MRCFCNYLSSLIFVIIVVVIAFFSFQMQGMNEMGSIINERRKKWKYIQWKAFTSVDFSFQNVWTFFYIEQWCWTMLNITKNVAMIMIWRISFENDMLWAFECFFMFSPAYAHFYTFGNWKGATSYTAHHKTTELIQINLNDVLKSQWVVLNRRRNIYVCQARSYH